MVQININSNISPLYSDFQMRINNSRFFGKKLSLVKKSGTDPNSHDTMGFFSCFPEIEQNVHKALTS